MKINSNRLPFTKKSCLLMLFFGCMFVFASFTKEDRQKVRSFKINLLSKFTGEKVDALAEDSKDEISTPSLDKINKNVVQNNSIELAHSENPIEKESEIPILNNETPSNAFSYPSKEKEGTIGRFTDQEQDRIADNFFTVDIPALTKENSVAYLEYDLFGLSSHQSVSRSINNNVAIGGDIIVPNAQWTHQKEAINAQLIRNGINTILFTSSAEGVKYKIKNLKIVFEKDKKYSDLNISSLFSGGQLYVKGNNSHSASLNVNNENVAVQKGEFEKLIQLSEGDKAKGMFSITTDGISKSYKIPTPTKAFKIINDQYYNAKSILISKDQEANIEYEGLTVKVDKETSESAHLQILKLRGKDFPSTTQGLKNVTSQNSAFRVSVVSGKLDKKIKMTIPYDEKRLGLVSPKEIKIFYFDYTVKQWKIEGSAVVDEKSKTVTVETNGDNDYINGIISVPESTQLNAFAPTSISGLKAGNPAAANQLLSPPTANQQGNASMSYPILMPSGVNGMQPNISVAYNSNGGNGWMGEGWDISGVSSITLDTKWGTPTFDAGNESEIYLLDGEMLIYQGDYLPHRQNSNNPDGSFDTTKQPRNGSGVKNFYLRKNNNFLKIERYGNTPANYRWIITGTNGTKKYYGGNESGVNDNAVLRTNAQKIVQWGVTKEIDIHNNNIKYYYDNSTFNSFVGENENLNGGKSIHISSIYYSGKNDADGPYRVLFNMETLQPPSGPLPFRQDLLIDAKHGVKRIEPRRLISVDTYYGNQGIKKYEFDYTQGEFYKTLLAFIVTDGIRYQLDYYKDTNIALFAKDLQVYAPTTDAFSSSVNSTLTPSKISSNNNLEWGWGLRIGAGFGLFIPHSSGDKNFMINGFTGESYPKNKGAQELIDFNGDGVPDILYRQRNSDNGIYYFPGSLDGNGDLEFSKPRKDVLNLRSNFAKTTGTTFNVRATALINWWKMGFDFTKSWSESESTTPVYLLDANSDGLPDVVNDGKVWFNQINDSGETEMVTTSEGTENMVITGNVPVAHTEADDPDDSGDDTEEPVKGKNDVVKVWIAPKSGYIKISDRISLKDPTHNPDAKAVYSIETKNPNDLPKNGRLYLTTLVPGVNQSVDIEHYNEYPSTPLGINNSSRIYIASGEKVFFRLHKKTGTNYIVMTSPIVQYVDANGITIDDSAEEKQDDFVPNSLKYEESFILNNMIKSKKAESVGGLPGIGSMYIPSFTIPKLNDAVTYSIVRYKIPITNPSTDMITVWSKTYPENTYPTIVPEINLSFPVQNSEQWIVKFIVKSDSYMDKSLEWKNIWFQGGNDCATYPSYYVKNFKHQYNLSTVSNLPNGTNDYSISINKNVGFTPTQAGNFTYIIKKNGHVLGKRAVTISATGVSESILSGTAITGLDPIAFYTGDPSLGVPVEERINILVYCDTYVDRLAYENFKSQHQNNIFNIYYGTNPQLLSSTVETSLSTGEFNGISAVYHNWGQFIYNSNKDVKPGSNPLNPPTDPKAWELQTGPTASSGPDYVINPDTPKDQYGMLINNSFMDAPWSQLNFNFSSCAGFLANSTEYVDCVGDILTANFLSSANNVVASFTPVVPLTVYNKKDEYGIYIEKWAHPMFPEQYSMPSSFRDEEIPGPFFVDDDPDEPDAPDSVVQGNINTKMFAIDKKQKSKAKTTNWGIGIPVISQSTSQLIGYGNINTQDFFDVNGDGYPDILYRNQLQMTNSLGGLKSASGGNIEGNGDSVISSTDSFQKANTIAFDPTAIKTVGRMFSGSSSDAKADSSTPWSGGLSFTNYPDSYDKGLKYWIDVNGDGLADRVEIVNGEFRYKLNYGSGVVNNGFERYNGLETNNSAPVGATGASVGYSIGGGLTSMLDVTTTTTAGWGVSGSVSGSASTGSANRTFQDVNGDGLVDIVTVINGYTFVKYNMGNKFADPQQMIKQTASIVGANASMSNEVKTYNGALNLGGGVYANIPLVTIFGVTVLYFRVGMDISANIGSSITEINKALRDVNGDGYPDLVNNTGDGFIVNYSRIGRTNKLAKVTEKNTNGTFSIDYGFTKPSYQDPNAKLVMKEVRIFNPNVESDKYTISTPGKDIITQYSYEKSKYDRRERANYGFTKVITREINGTTVESKTVETFYNTTFYNNGLPRKTEVYRGDGNFLASQTDNSYQLYKYINNYTQIEEIPSSQFDTYDTGGTEGRKIAAVLPDQNNETVFENGGSIATYTAMRYNNKAQLTYVKYVSNQSWGSYNSSIDYHDNALLSSKNILNIPSQIRVTDDNGVMHRERNTEVDYNTGEVTKVMVKLNSGETAETQINYNADGNITNITYPGDYNLLYEYDVLGKYVTNVTDSFGVTSSASYDPRWDVLVESTDVTGSIMQYDYDARGRLINILAPKEVGVSPYTVKYSYFLAPMTLNNITFNLHGAITQNFDAAHPANPIETISLSDFTGEVVQVKKDIEMPDGEKMSVSGMVIKDALGRPVTQYHPVYEDKNTILNKKLKYDLSPYFATTGYDQLDRVTSTTDEDGNVTNTDFDIAGLFNVKKVTQLQNASVQVKSEILTTAEGRTISTRNYLAGQPLITNYTYNCVGDLLRTVDPENIITLYEYDLAGRRIVENHPDHGITRFNYDQAGHLVSRSTANLVSSGVSDPYITYEYNLNRLMAIHYPNLPNGAANPANVTYTYGHSGFDNGRLTLKVDETGTTSYHYGNMGEINQEVREVVGVNIPTMHFFTGFNYDSWNRLTKIIYPDTEQVSYDYDLGGNLKTMTSNVSGEYVKEIQYDEYEQRTKIKFGNDTYSTFEYKPTSRMLSNHALKKDNFAEYLNNGYTYDNVGNILNITNTSAVTPNLVGGVYQMIYGYDQLNRLVSSSGSFLGNIKANPGSIGDLTASYETLLSYRDASGIDNKTQTHTVDGIIKPQNTYSNMYEYFDGTHQLTKVTNANTGINEVFEYDHNGNPTYHSSFFDGERYMYWDEEDNMKAFYSDDAAIFQYYTYNDIGERTIKYTLNSGTSLYQNGVMIDPGTMVMTGYKFYPNPYIVVSSDNKYTKHYYTGTQRIASRLADNPGLFNRTATTPKSQGGQEVVDPEKDFKNYLGKAGLETTKIDTEFAKTSSQDGLYYLHGDHLGTATYVTDDSGTPTQFFLNLPFGETFAEQQIIGKYENPYKFNAKELDSETGFYYYGARYYNPRLSVWYGVDPLKDEFPNVSPYVYTLQNPVRLIDPDGNAPAQAELGCCANAKGMILALADDVMSTNLRNKYATNSQAYRDGVNSGHGAALVLGALMMTDGAGSAGAGGVGLAVSGIASATGVGSGPGAAGAAVSGGLVLKGGIEMAGATVILHNAIGNAKGDAAKNTKHTDNRHVDRTKYPEKSKYLKPSQKEKLQLRTIKNPDKITDQGRRIRYDKNFNRIIGTREETSHRVIIDKKTKKIVTSFPQKK